MRSQRIQKKLDKLYLQHDALYYDLIENLLAKWEQTASIEHALKVIKDINEKEANGYPNPHVNLRNYLDNYVDTLRQEQLDWFHKTYPQISKFWGNLQNQINDLAHRE